MRTFSSGRGMWCGNYVVRNQVMNTKHKMTEPWADIVAWYGSIKDMHPSWRGVYDLVCWIESSPRESGLFAWTSMHDLCVTQTEVWYPDDMPYLRVEPMLDGKVCFRYVDTWDE